MGYRSRTNESLAMLNQAVGSAYQRGQGLMEQALKLRMMESKMQNERLERELEPIKLKRDMLRERLQMDLQLHGAGLAERRADNEDTRVGYEGQRVGFEGERVRQSAEQGRLAWARFGLEQKNFGLREKEFLLTLANSQFNNELKMREFMRGLSQDELKKYEKILQAGALAGQDYDRQKAAYEELEGKNAQRVMELLENYGRLVVDPETGEVKSFQLQGQWKQLYDANLKTSFLPQYGSEEAFARAMIGRVMTRAEGIQSTNDLQAFGDAIKDSIKFEYFKLAAEIAAHTDDRETKSSGAQAKARRYLDALNKGADNADQLRNEFSLYVNIASDKLVFQSPRAAIGAAVNSTTDGRVRPTAEYRAMVEMRKAWESAGVNSPRWQQHFAQLTTEPSMAAHVALGSNRAHLREQFEVTKDAKARHASLASDQKYYEQGGSLDAAYIDTNVREAEAAIEQYGKDIEDLDRFTFQPSRPVRPNSDAEGVAWNKITRGLDEGSDELIEEGLGELMVGSARDTAAALSRLSFHLLGREGMEEGRQEIDRDAMLAAAGDEIKSKGLSEELAYAFPLMFRNESGFTNAYQGAAADGRKSTAIGPYQMQLGYTMDAYDAAAEGGSHNLTRVDALKDYVALASGSADPVLMDRMTRASVWGLNSLRGDAGDNAAGPQAIFGRYYQGPGGYNQAVSGDQEIRGAIDAYLGKMPGLLEDQGAADWYKAMGMDITPDMAGVWLNSAQGWQQ